MKLKKWIPTNVQKLTLLTLKNIPKFYPVLGVFWVKENARLSLSETGISAILKTKRDLVFYNYFLVLIRDYLLTICATISASAQILFPT